MNRSNFDQAEIGETMEKCKIKIENIPAVIYGHSSDCVYLFVHGQNGNKEEAQSFAEIAAEKGWQVLGIDLPEHGERKAATELLVPWVVLPELQTVWQYLETHWQRIALRANSIGAWFSMLAFQEQPLEQSLFVSPILDMEGLIRNMMQWAGVTAERLAAEKTIQTTFGQTLSWEYFVYAQQHPITQWHDGTKILYGSEDNLTERGIVDAFANRFECDLKVMDHGEHWFHTEAQLAFLREWEQQNSLI